MVLGAGATWWNPGIGNTSFMTENVSLLFPDVSSDSIFKLVWKSILIDYTITKIELLCLVHR